MNDKKQLEHIEDKIRAAAENIQPAFDEKAWQAMDAMLDKEEKKHRPFLWWWILPVLLAGGFAFYFLAQHSNTISQQHNSNATTDKTFTEERKLLPVLKNENNIAAVTDKKENESTGISAADASRRQVAGNEKVAGEKNTASPFSALPGKRRFAGHKKVTVINAAAGEDDNKVSRSKTTEKIKEDGTDAVQEDDRTDAPVTDKPAAPVNDSNTIAKNTESTVAKKDAVKVTGGQKQPDTSNNKKTSTANNKKKSVKSFYLFAAGGADAGSTKLLSFSGSSIVPKYGLGLGYQFAKRFSVQSGFFITSKKYGAAPGDYTIKPGSPMAMYEMEKIKAAFTVYEIPLSVRYDVISKPSVIIYATAGASSYILHKERYNCFYNYYNTTYEQEWDYTGNKHFFSTAVFSLGIEKKLSSRFSIIAEPSFSVPLAGVGDGSMKIYSAALQAGLKYHFFKK